jgi:cyclopropane-fatty-acyl-phospholipid synthase
MPQISTSPTCNGKLQVKSAEGSRPERSNSGSIAQAALRKGLANLRQGRLTLFDGFETQFFGQDSLDGLQAEVTVHDPELYKHVLFGGSLGAAESFLQGHWSSHNLTNVLRLFARNLDTSDQLDRGMGRIKKLFARTYHALRNNSLSGSKRNIHEHYDLGNSFFSLFLDDTMMYSSAFFEQSNMTLRDASTAKLDRICRKLDLKPSDHVLEIGTGWGGFAEFSAQNYGCRITTTTISQEQYDYSQARIQAAGLSDRVTLLLQDYRELTGQYDKLVSIEMIEAVGHQYYDTFFSKCGELLKQDGVMLLQGITMPEQRYADYLKSVDFIQRYIFPGGCLPSVLAMGQSVASQSDMRLLHLEDLSEHYARTLQLWRKKFFDQIDEVRLLGFSERFIRMWEYYFCYCEAAFLERLTGVVQVVYAKPACRIDSINTQEGQR